MRFVTSILLAVLAVAALGPGSFLLTVPVQGSDDVLEALDVCHRSAPALSGGGEMPCTQSGSFLVEPMFSGQRAALTATTVTAVLHVFPQDRPPKMFS